MSTLSNTDLSVIVPAYNEAERLPETLRRIQEFLQSGSLKYEIIVVLNGPGDNTRTVMDRLNREIDHLKVLDLQVRRGKGYAVRQGILSAAGRVRLFTDADNSTDISHLERMAPLFASGCDVVICSRDPRDAPGAVQAVPQVWPKRLLGKMGNLYIRWIVLKGIWDTQCGFKAFRDYAAEKIFSRAVIDGWGFDVEALALAHALQYKVGIVPATWINHPKSHVSPAAYLQVLSETLRVRYRLRSGRYRI